MSVTGTAQDGIDGGVSVAVPSRLYFPRPSPERPLEGKRLAVKDIFDLKGTVTGAGSRYYFALQKVAEKNAASLQELIDLGAVVVGKAKPTFFALGESPTADYVDQLAPFNPRGEGYQSPQGSSCPLELLLPPMTGSTLAPVPTLGAAFVYFLSRADCSACESLTQVCRWMVLFPYRPSLIRLGC